MHFLALKYFFAWDLRLKPAFWGGLFGKRIPSQALEMRGQESWDSQDNAWFSDLFSVRRLVSPWCCSEQERFSLCQGLLYASPLLLRPPPVPLAAQAEETCCDLFIAALSRRLDQMASKGPLQPKLLYIYFAEEVRCQQWAFYKGT